MSSPEFALNPLAEFRRQRRGTRHEPPTIAGRLRLLPLLRWFELAVLGERVSKVEGGRNVLLRANALLGDRIERGRIRGEVASDEKRRYRGEGAEQ